MMKTRTVPHHYRADSLEDRTMVDATEPLTFTVMPADCKPEYVRDEFNCALATALKKIPGTIDAQVKRKRCYLLYRDGKIVRYCTPSVIQAAFDREIIRIPEEGIQVTIKPVHKSARFDSRTYKRSLRRARSRKAKALITKGKKVTVKKRKQYRIGDLELSLRHGGSKCAFLRD